MLDIYWKTGQMHINMKRYFPCPITILQKLYELCIRDCINYDEVKKKVNRLFQHSSKVRNTFGGGW